MIYMSVHLFIYLLLLLNYYRKNIQPQLVAYTNELSYLLEDDDNSTELVHAVYFVSPIDAH